MREKPLDVFLYSCDYGTQFSGCDRGPLTLVPFCRELGMTVHDVPRAYHVGERPPLGSPERTALVQECCIALYQEMLEKGDGNTRILLLGGDHSGSLASIAAFTDIRQTHTRTALIWIDAHMDAHTWETTPSQTVHGMPVAIVHGHGGEEFTKIGSRKTKILPQHTYLIGCRSYETGEEEYLEQAGARIFRQKDIVQQTPDHLADRLIAELRNENFDAVVISVDLDVIDPQEAPGTGSRVGPGLSASYILRLLERLVSELNPSLCELMEFNPDLDENDKTFALAKKIIRIYAGETFSGGQG